jgi:WD40 repeat protein
MLLTTIPFGNTIKSLAYNPDGSAILAGSTIPNNKFSSFLTVDPYTETAINTNPTLAVSAFSTYYVQATATNIEIFNFEDNSLAGTIPLPNAKSVSVSENGIYLIAGDGTNVEAWNIETIDTPTRIIQTAGIGFGISLSGSNLMVQTSLANNGFS